MKYQGVDICEKCEWILARLSDSDGWVKRKTLKEEMLTYDKFTKHKFRTAIGKIETLNFVEPGTEPTDGGINDAKKYKLNQTVLESYLEEKGQLGFESRLSEPKYAEDIDVMKEEIRKEVLAELSEEVGTRLSQLESEQDDMRDQLQDLKQLFHGRGERMKDIEKEYEYLREHREVEEEHWDALERLLEDHHVDFGEYF